MTQPTNFTPERCLAYAYLAKMADMMESRLLCHLPEHDYKIRLEELTEQLARSVDCSIQRDPLNDELPNPNEYVLIQLLQDFGTTDPTCLKKVYYAKVYDGDGDWWHWFNDEDDNFFCEVDDIAFWWRLPALPIDMENNL